MRSIPGKAIVLSTRVQQHGHGWEQYMTIGDPKDAVSVFLDKDGHIQNADKPYQCFDGWMQSMRGPIFFTKHLDYSHQKFTVNADGTIALTNNKSRVFGTNKEQTEIEFVDKSSPFRIVFLMTSLLLGSD